MAENAFLEGLASSGRMMSEGEKPAPGTEAAAPGVAATPDVTAGPGVAPATPVVPTLEDHATLDHPTESAQVLWVSGQEKPFVIHIPMLYEQRERFSPLLELDRGSVVPLDLLKDAHIESLKRFQVEPELPKRVTRGSLAMSEEALEQMRAEKDAREKALREQAAFKKDLVKEGAQAYQGSIPGNGFLAQILKAYQEGLLEGYLAAHKTREGVAKVAQGTVQAVAQTARGIAKVKSAGVESAKAVASVVRKSPKPAVSAIKLDIEKLAAETARPNGSAAQAYVPRFSNGVKNAKSTVNVEFIEMSADRKGAVLRFTDAAGKDIGADVAAATGKEYKTGGVFGKGAVYLDSKTSLVGETAGATEKNLIEKLVYPTLAKMKLAYPTAVTFGKGPVPELAASAKEAATAAPVKAEKSAKKDRGMER